MNDFDHQTRPRKIDDGTFAVDISRAWEVWGPNGGYTSALLLRAVGAMAPERLPISFAGQYLRVPSFGPALIEVETSKEGRSISAFQARLVQDGEVQQQALVWVGDDGAGPTHCLVELPPYFVPLEAAGPRPPVGPMPFWSNLEIRGVKSSEGRYSHWYRFVPELTIDDPFLDAARSVVLIDTMQWPARYFMDREPPDYVAPSLDLYVQFHDDGRRSEWLFCDAVSLCAERGVLAGEARVWDQEGRLLASGGSQAALRPLRKSSAE